MKINLPPETYRVYSKPKKLHEDYYEAPYKEYNSDGSLYCEGSEDFTTDRLCSKVKTYNVYTYNGRINKAGGRMTDYAGTIRITQNACAIQVARRLYENVARVKRIK